MVIPEVDDSFKSITEITESIESSNEELKIDIRTIGNNANCNNVNKNMANQPIKLVKKIEVVTVCVHQFKSKTKQNKKSNCRKNSVTIDPTLPIERWHFRASQESNNPW